MFTNTQPNKTLLSRREMDLTNFNKAMGEMCEQMRGFHNLLFHTSLEMPKHIFEHLKSHYVDTWQYNNSLETPIIEQLHNEANQILHDNPLLANADVTVGRDFKLNAWPIDEGRGLSKVHHIPGLIDNCPTLFGCHVSEGESFKLVAERGLCKVEPAADNWPTIKITGKAPVEIPVNYTPIRWFSKGLIPIVIKSRTNPLYDVDPRENRALETLREMVSEENFRKYLKDGFLIVTGKSGYTYQIDRHRHHTIIRNKGKMVGEVCIRVKGGVPPTDNVIAFKTMVESDEEFFKSQGNFYNYKKQVA